MFWPLIGGGKELEKHRGIKIKGKLGGSFFLFLLLGQECKKMKSKRILASVKRNICWNSYFLIDEVYIHGNFYVWPVYRSRRSQMSLYQVQIWCRRSIICLEMYTTCNKQHNHKHVELFFALEVLRYEALMY